MSQEDLFQNPSESSQQDTPVSLSQPQEKGRVRKTLATSSRTYLGLLHKQDRLLPFSRMFTDTSLWAWTRYSMEWKVKVTPSGRLLCQLAVSAPATNATESGYWATPNTMDHLPQRSPEALLKQATKARKGRTRPANLREQVDPNTVEMWQKAQEPKMWATPRTTDVTGGPRQLDEQGRRVSKSNPNLKFGANLADQVKMWPTPRASEYKDTGPVGSKSHTHMKDKKYLCAAVKETAQPNGKLNPVWVEWLMGYPIGWTALKD